jgi:hypothetical protein
MLAPWQYCNYYDKKEKKHSTSRAQAHVSSPVTQARRHRLIVVAVGYFDSGDSHGGGGNGGMQFISL